MCHACGRTHEVEVTDRGPVKVPVETRQRGAFRLCDGCLAAMDETTRVAGGMTMLRLTVVRPRKTAQGASIEGHSWIVGYDQEVHEG